MVTTTKGELYWEKKLADLDIEVALQPDMTLLQLGCKSLAILKRNQWAQDWLLEAKAMCYCECGSPVLRHIHSYKNWSNRCRSCYCQRTTGNSKKRQRLQ